MPKCQHEEIGYLYNEDEDPCNRSRCDDPAEYNCKACGLELCEAHSEAEGWLRD